MAIVTTRAAAKLNLALAVDAPRPDGLHPISSWMISIDLADDLTVWRLPEDRFSRYAILWHDEALSRSDINWSVKRDLAVRAHRALEAHEDRPLPVQMKLEKRIPVAAGLGGGSADAAAMLRAVRHLYELPIGDDELASIAQGLGSDVPFFLHGGSAIVEGTGDAIRRSDALPPLHAALIFPPCACSTPEVYRRFDELPRPAFRPDAVERLAASCGTLTAADAPGTSSASGTISASQGAAERHAALRAPAPDALFNDLARAAFRVAPALEAHCAAVAAIADRPAHVTGSGSAFFVICDDAMHAEYLAAAITQRTELPALAVSAAHRATIEQHDTLAPGDRTA